MFVACEVVDVHGSADHAAVQIKSTDAELIFLISPRSMLDMAAKLTRKARFLEAQPPDHVGVQ